jgi:phage terminase large subunit
MKIQVPYGWSPRPYQMPLWMALQGGVKRAVAVWHRRAGKDLFFMNWMARESFRRVGLYWHIFPTYRQGKNAVWLGSTRDGRKFLDHFPLHDRGIPNEIIARKREDELTMWFANGSTYQVVGADQPDRLVGANPIGVVFSEWSLMDPAAWELIRPILAENGGWAAWIYTPRGRNHGYSTLQKAREMALKHPDRWFAEVLTVDQTHAVKPEAIQEDRDSGMAEEMVKQEYWCSFDAPLTGSYYGELMTAAFKEKRICKVPWDPLQPVSTGWDLGHHDDTTIWFFQQVQGAVRIIDYYQARGVGLPHYVKVLKDKPYVYSRHLVPHDAGVTEWGSGKTRVEQAKALGLMLTVQPRLPLDDGIQAVRGLLPRCLFDEEKTELGRQALLEYSKRPTGERDPAGNPIYEDTPLKNWACHPADGFRTVAVGIRAVRKREPVRAPQVAMV